MRGRKSRVCDLLQRGSPAVLICAEKETELEKTIKIVGVEVKLVANGGTPRLYRAMFRRDVFNDMSRAVTDSGEINDSEVFENLAFIMAKQGGLEGYDVEEWLASFESPTAIIEAAPQIMALWVDTSETTAQGKKK